MLDAIESGKIGISVHVGTWADDMRDINGQIQKMVEIKAELLRLAKIGAAVVQMHKDCSDCSTDGICSEIIDCFDKECSVCQNCDCCNVCELLVSHYYKEGQP